MHPRPSPRRVLFCLKLRQAPYGDGYGWGGECGDQLLSSGLFNSARFMADMLAAAGTPTKLVHVIDGNFIHREIVAFGATDVVVEAFYCPPAKFDDLRKVCPKVRFIVRNHSETPFLASEGMAFGWSADYLDKPNVVLAPNSPRMLADTRTLARIWHPEWDEAEVERKVPYLPNFYPYDLPVQPKKVPDVWMDIGCFGAVRPLKNTILQAIAALQLAQGLGMPLRFHVNAGRVEMGGSPIVKNLYAIFDSAQHAQLVDHPWLPHDAFRALVAQMDMVSQVTLSETFSIVSADAASQSVPVVTSSEVPWSSQLSQADPNDGQAIAAALARAWQNRHRADANLIGLRRFSANSRSIWLSYFRP